MTDTWTLRANLSTVRGPLHATASGGKVYVVGLPNGSGSSLVVEEYDPAANTWAARGPGFKLRMAAALAVGSAGELYLIGGSQNAPATTVEEYDPTANVWREHPGMLTPRGNLGAVGTPDGKIYAIGGNNSSGYLATIEEATIRR